MKEMIRLRTTTQTGKVLLSPFVFTKKEAKRRIEKPKLEDPGNRTETVKVPRYPRTAIWTEKRFGISVISIETLILRILAIEKLWEVMESGTR